VQSVVARSLTTAVLASVLLGGCGLTHLQDLNFRVDDRLHFLSPEPRALVHPPLTVRWTMDDFTIVRPGSAPPSRDAGYFAVFVDRAPIHPGETLDAVGKGDPVCDPDPKCPDTQYLHDHGVYPTTAMQLRLPHVIDLRGNREKVQLHTITVVLLDTAGRRIGESAWELDVRIPRIGVL